MSQSSSLATNSLAPHHLPDEELHHMIVLKHEGRLQEATEGDRLLRAMGLLVVDAVPHIDRPHHQEEGRRLEGMEDDQI